MVFENVVCLHLLAQQLPVRLRTLCTVPTPGRSALHQSPETPLTKQERCAKSINDPGIYGLLGSQLGTPYNV